MKKVLDIVPYQYLPYYAGGQKFIAGFLHYMGKETDLTVAGVPGNDASLAGTYKLIPLLKPTFKRYFDYSLVRKITALIRREKFDTIIWWHPYYSWLAYRIRKRTGIKTIIQTHNIEYQRFKSIGKWWWRILKHYEKRCLQKADAVFFVIPEDRQFAITEWGLAKEKCFDAPFGLDITQNPDDRPQARDFVCREHNIQADEKIILFNGMLSYKPNLDALKAILEKINPVLLDQNAFKYKIIVCGKGLPAELNELKGYQDKNIIYTGFVKDIDTYFKAADIFLNPVQTGGGIKTKMVEAIGFGTTVIATASGATGIVKEVCGDKLFIVADDDWGAFTRLIIEKISHTGKTPASYYDYYFYGNSVKRLIQSV